ncbi:6082_t:CDS:1, partial [Acaulospora morrowiae]
PQEELKNQQTNNKSSEEQQTQYQDAEEVVMDKKETPLATYKAINKKAAER